jgi:HEAT repeat protein
MKDNLRDILRDIKGTDVAARMAAVERLRGLPRKNGKAVMELIEDKEGDIRVLGCRILSEMRPAGTVKVLLTKTRDTDPNVRGAACTALGKFRNSMAVAGLTEALQDKSWIAYAAACSLGEIGGKRALLHLRRLLHQKDGLKAMAACEALLKWHDPDVVNELVDMVQKCRGRKRDGFVRIILEQGGREVLERLRTVLGDKLLGHLHFLMRREYRTPVTLLLFAAEFENQEACSLILQELAKRGPDDDEYADILELFSRLHRVWRDRIETYLALLDEASILHLVRACAATGTRIKEKTLREALIGSPLETKREIVRNLTLIADPSVWLINDLLFDSDDHVRGDAAQAAAFYNMDELSSRVEELARAGFPDTRQKALRSLCRLKPGRAHALAEEFVNHGNADDKKIYLSVADAIDKETNYRLIRRLLHSKDVQVGALAAGVVGRMVGHDPRYLDLLRELLNKKRLLPETLEIIKEKRLTAFEPTLLDLLAEPHHNPWTRFEILSALAAMNDAALFDLFSAGLHDRHNLIIIASIKGLSSLGERRSVKLIRPFLEHPDPDLRHVAESAIGVLTGDNREVS